MAKFDLRANAAAVAALSAIICGKIAFKRQPAAGRRKVCYKKMWENVCMQVAKMAKKEADGAHGGGKGNRVRR